MTGFLTHDWLVQASNERSERLSERLKLAALRPMMQTAPLEWAADPRMISTDASRALVAWPDQLHLRTVLIAMGLH
jgi:hypothetical protein